MFGYSEVRGENWAWGDCCCNSLRRNTAVTQESSEERLVADARHRCMSWNSPVCVCVCV